MVEEVVWSDRAIRDYNMVISYLLEKWSEREVGIFVRATERTIHHLIEHPRMFRKTKFRNVHEALITPHNLLYYHVSGNYVQRLMIWDTRQNPRKNKYKIR